MSDIVVTVVNSGSSPVVVDGETFSGPTVTNGAVVTLQYATVTQSLAGMSDVAVSSAASGDLLRFDGSRWTNYPERGLILDGGNW